MEQLEFDDRVSLFDQGEIFQNKEYHAAKEKESDLYRLLSATFGERIELFLDTYTEAVEERMDLEVQHYFQQGILMGRRTDLA